MKNTIKIGQQVTLLDVPNWLVHDLPNDERQEILSHIGKIATVSEIDSYGYYWIGFGNTTEEKDSAFYSGHLFCVPQECLEIGP